MMQLSYQDPPLKADKGQKDGSCNRTACQKPGATWYNRSTLCYYCRDCARLINRANPDAQRELDLDGPLCVEVAAVPVEVSAALSDNAGLAMRTDFDSLANGQRVTLHPRAHNPLHKRNVVATYQGGYFYCDGSPPMDGPDYYMGDVLVYNEGFTAL